jgi:hypothetical protein
VEVELGVGEAGSLVTRCRSSDEDYASISSTRGGGGSKFTTFRDLEM